MPRSRSGVGIGGRGVAVPEPQPVVVQKHEPAHPLHTLPAVQMRYDQPHGAAVIRCQWFAVVFERKENVWTKQIVEWNVGCIAFFPYHEGELPLRFWLHNLLNTSTTHPLPPL